MNDARQAATVYFAAGGLRGRLYDSAGDPSGVPFDISSSVLAEGDVPFDVELTNGGVAIFVWTAAGAGSSDGDDTAIFARMFNSAGQPTGDAFMVNSPAVGNRLSPTVDSAADGRFVIGWRQCATTACDIAESQPAFVQRFDASGNQLGGPVAVAPHATKLAIAVAADGHFVAAWSNGSEGFASRFAADGQPVGGRIRLGLEPWEVGVADDRGFIVRSNTSLQWISWLASDDEASLGPWVKSFEPSAIPAGGGPLNQIELAFAGNLTDASDGKTWTLPLRNHKRWRPATQPRLVHEFSIRTATR